MLTHGLAILLAFCVLVRASAGVAQTAAKDIDLELFERSQIDRDTGCSVVLWQHDRNPEQDKHAYLFHEPLIGQNHVRQSARIKIGDEITLLKRVATGGNSPGYRLFEYQLYQLPEENEFAILELKLAEMQLGAVEVVSGKLTVVMDRKPKFRVSVKGKASCATSDAVVPPDEGNKASSGSRKPSSSSPNSIMTACFEAAKSTDIPTDFECDWKGVVASSQGATLSGKYKLRANGADGVMTILEPDDGPAYVGIQTLRHSTTAVCDVGMGALRGEKNELIARFDDPGDCDVRVSRIRGTTSVKVTTTKQCNPDLCGNGTSFDGQWVLTTK